MDLQPVFNLELEKAEADFEDRLDFDIAGLLKSSGRKIAVGESLTAGLLSERLTRVPGSSSYFKGGVVCYSTESKLTFCGVQAATLSQFGAVSGPVATELAKGVQRGFKAQVGIGITGYAGPDRLDPDKTGLVFICIAIDQDVKVNHVRLSGDRQAIKEQAVQTALIQLKQRLTVVTKKEILNGR